MSDSLTVPIKNSSLHKLPLQIVVIALGQLIIKTSRRFLYPYAPALSRGLGVPLISVISLIAINQFTSIFSPLFGPLSDRWGYRIMMMAGLGLLAFGMLFGGFLPYYFIILLALFLGGLGKAIFDPALFAYIGEKVPYKQRGLVIGLTEMSWAGAALIGIPLIGLFISRLGWRAPFFVIGGLALLFMITLGSVIPAEKRDPPDSNFVENFIEDWKLLAQERAALGMLALGFFMSLANDNLFVIYGVWLENSFALSIVALGTATSMIGLAELCGESLTVTIADKIGLKRAIIIGLTLSGLSYLLLPFISQSLFISLSALFAIFMTFEFTVVTSFSLATEVLPTARATMGSAYVAANGLGHMIGALIGGQLWLWGGLPAIGLLSTGLTVVGLLCLVWGLRYWQASSEISTPGH